MCELWTTYTTNIDDPNTVIDTLGQDGEVPSGHSVQVQVVQAQVLHVCDVTVCGAGVICLYRYFVIFLLVLISFPTAKSFLQRIFTPKKFFGPSGHKITYKSYISS